MHRIAALSAIVLALGASTQARSAGSAGRKAWARQDSNLHRTGYEPAALTVELRAHASGAA